MKQNNCQCQISKTEYKISPDNCIPTKAQLKLTHAINAQVITVQYFETQPIMPKKLMTVITVFLVIIALMYGYMFYEQAILGKTSPDNAIDSHWVLIICVITALVAWYVSKIQIITKIDEGHLYLSIGAFGKTKIALNDIEKVSFKLSNPAKEFLGFGYRIKPDKLGYIGRGKEAIEITAKGEKRTITVTTDNASSLREALQLNVDTTESL